MQIYKTFFRVASQHKVSIIMYFCIIVFMLLAMTGGSSDESKGSVTLAKYPILIEDEDNSDISKMLVDYLDEKHELKEGSFTEDQIKSLLYYERISVYIVIPKGFGDAFKEAIETGNQNDMTALLESTYDDAMPRGIFVNMQINEYLNAVADYMKLGCGLNEASEKAVQSLDISRFAAMQEKEINTSYKIYTSFTFLPYGILSIIFSSVMAVILSFNEKEKKDRTIVSSYKMTSRNIALVLGTLSVAVIVTTLLITITSVTNDSSFIFTKQWWLSVLNAMVYTLSVTLLLSMLTSLPLGIEKKGTSNTSVYITNIIGLSFAFLGGTFVDLTILGDKVAKIGRFIPNYWYSTASHKIWYDGAGFNDLIECFGFQILFGLVCLSIGLVFTKFFANRGKN